MMTMSAVTMLGVMPLEEEGLVVLKEEGGEPEAEAEELSRAKSE